ncbi:MAG TPA: phosphoenolpyruvate--protein phosphotransferase [Verrucomicrobiae bacterium]|nr:phosphoenolpyruvate--protein phosphotransferase [Verrucomicrobiae bacterium]
MPEPAHKGEKVFRGIPVSAGVCRGKVLVLGRAHSTIPKHEVRDEHLHEEINRLERALIQTRQQILEVQRKVCDGMGAEEGGIFDAHLLVLEDRTLLDEVMRNINEQKVNAEYAFHIVAEKYATTLAAIEDDYLRERATDMRDVTSRILNNLLGRQEDIDLKKLKEPCVIISYDLSPSTTAQMDRRVVLGFATDIGGKTSHSAIMARSLRIPAVVGLKNLSQELETGQYILLDGFNGIVILNPTDATLFEYGQIIRNQVSLEEKLKDIQGKPAVTMDGHQIMLSANVEHPSDASEVQGNGAEGVGLFRTEYLFINRTTLPTEEEQYQAYRSIAVALKPHPVVVRTMDLGGDKFLSHLKLPAEMNPFLGWRAIRYSLQEKPVFSTQLRAILRAGAEGNVKMMYPMISGVEELKQANAVVEECKAELRAEKIPFDENLEIGAMIEIPSAAMVADALARHLKFLSLGTNDLIQYTLAVDRMNERVAHLYEPTHPAIIRLIKYTVDAAHKNNIWVGVCGEMAGDPTLTALLLGLGVDELSAAPPLVPPVKFMIRRLKMNEARTLADFALNCDSSSEILTRCQALAREIAPSLFESKS